MNKKSRKLVLLFETTEEAYQELENLLASGELDNLLQAQVVEMESNVSPGQLVEDEDITPKAPKEVNQNLVSKAGIQLSQWFQRVPEIWGKYERILLGIYNELEQLNPSSNDDSAFNASLTKSVNNLQTQIPIEERKDKLIAVLINEKKTFNLRFNTAVRLVKEFKNSEVTPEIIEVLANYLPSKYIKETAENREEIALIWQIALSLGQFAPEHPKAAFAQIKEILLNEDLTLELLVAIKRRCDGDIDIYIQVYSMEEPYLPPNLQLVVLDEFGQKMLLDQSSHNFLETQSHQQDAEIHLSFFSSFDQSFIVEISFNEIIVTENFVI
ncbi:DUF1822 family protein [Anabaena sp. CCY 0017]|uniref:DUF1822 family protein n=1 Tax=Anabaena sp. CCY 0017 TaxID=3103866 RepID=UPI0039C68C83